MLLADGRVVSLARLVDAVWGEEPPATAEKQIRNAVSLLRGELRDLGAEVETVQPGYRLTLPAGSTDLAAFRDGVARARDCAALGMAGEAIALYRRALELWRGSALFDLDSGVLSSQVLRLEEERLCAVEARVELELEEGGQPSVTAELLELVATHPERERLAACLMTALCHSGEPCRALAVYEGQRRVLWERFGTTPGAELEELRERIASRPAGLIPGATACPDPERRRGRDRHPTDRPRPPLRPQPAARSVPEPRVCVNPGAGLSHPHVVARESR
jgi:DNA-binding SARP family transcriptional activator